VVTAAEMLARAGFLAGREAQAIPSFGSERTGAPVVAYCRFDDRPIRTREPVLAPDVVLVQDPTLIRSEDPLDGLVAGGLLVVSTEHSPSEVLALARDAHQEAGRETDIQRGREAIGLARSTEPADDGDGHGDEHTSLVRVVALPALRFAMEHLGVPKPSAAMLGAYAAATGLITLEAVQQVFRTRYPGKVGDGNAAAAAAAFAFVERLGTDAAVPTQPGPPEAQDNPVETSMTTEVAHA
jgi:pyruvate ferredoxin oxidoreductase gamma subunit